MINWYEVNYQHRNAERAVEKHVRQQQLVQDANEFQQRGQYSQPLSAKVARWLHAVLRYPSPHTKPEYDAACTKPMVSMHEK